MKPLITSDSSDITLTDKTILVTGASSGIGKQVAIACAKKNATVILSGRDDSRLNSVYDTIRDLDAPEPAIMQLDLESATEGELRNTAEVIKQNIGSLNGFVHCATHMTELKTLRHHNLKDWERALRINVIAPSLLIQACESLLNESGSGSVILTSDNHSKSLGAYWGAYAVSKAALEAFVRLQRNEWSNASSIRINTVTPGPIDSPMRSRTHPGEDRASLPSIESIIPTFVYLLSDSSRHINGDEFS
jgi:NAD(P)-dependent dehydrogenase (short-subunit alcohol dehydrogenase family)